GGFPFAFFQAWIAAGRLGRRVYIRGGGATPLAVLGHLLAALEVGRQLESPPDAIVTPLGSGGTAAGLLLGCSLLGWPTKVVAVRVAPRVVSNRWRIEGLVRGARRLLLERGIPLPHIPTPPRLSFTSPRLWVVNGMGSGYGVVSAAGEAGRQWGAESGLVIDSTYGGKTLALLPEIARAGCRRVVFWHTYAAPGSAE
ncbi:MAG TPA: pyridoxal-phosphate dependent enzyme, partial [Gemmatimonadales bacterium]|nr:pyridoxal-phosphate dependent enzyme [Gemmatimonadales bacterium]